MDYHQLLRIDRCYNEQFFLLEKTKKNNILSFKIAGTTLNVYEINIDLKSRKITCDCPDKCKQFNTSCKHECFILLKVLKIKNLDVSKNYFKTQFLNDEIIELINKQFNIENNNDVIDQNLINKYKNLDENNIIIDTEEHMCPICYDNIEDPKNSNINIQCKCCKKIFHKKCIGKWFDLGKVNCPYCRSENIQNTRYKNLI